jgi:hypothetical protein
MVPATGVGNRVAPACGLHRTARAAERNQQRCSWTPELRIVLRWARPRVSTGKYQAPPLARPLNVVIARHMKPQRYGIRTVSTSSRLRERNAALEADGQGQMGHMPSADSRCKW